MASAKDPLMREIGARLREARKAAGFTQEEMVKRVDGLDRHQLSRLENANRGARIEPFLRLLRELYTHGVNLHYVLLGQGGPIRRAGAITDNPELLDELIRIAERLGGKAGVANRGPANGVDEPKRAAHD